MKCAALASITVCMIALGYSTIVRADAIIENGTRSCGDDDLIIDGVQQLHLPKEVSGVVDVSDRKVHYRCVGPGNFESDITCPVGTNRFYAHRQKADNSEWLYECRVKS
jgi:hypothetical protein